MADSDRRIFSIAVILTALVLMPDREDLPVLKASGPAVGVEFEVVMGGFLAER